MNSVKHSRTFTLNQSVDALFPLFSPEGEKLWVPNWNYENIMGSTDLHEDYVFLTQVHDHAFARGCLEISVPLKDLAFWLKFELSISFQK